MGDYAANIKRNIIFNDFNLFIRSSVLTLRMKFTIHVLLVHSVTLFCVVSLFCSFFFRLLAVVAVAVVMCKKNNKNKFLFLCFPFQVIGQFFVCMIYNLRKTDISSIL